MRYFLTLLTVSLFAAAAIPAVSHVRGTAAEKPAKLLRHIVLYKFKEDLTAAQLREVVDTFAALPQRIDAIVDFEYGTNVSEEGKSEGLTHCFVVTFRDEQGRDAYLEHPAHQEYVKIVRDRRETVLVFDYWTDAK